MTDSPLHLELTPAPDGAAGTTLVVVGEIDLATVPELREALRRADEGGDPFVLDLREVTFLDSTGLQVLLLLDAERRRAGRPWTLEASPAVRHVCDVSGVSARLPMQAGRDAG